MTLILVWKDNQSIQEAPEVFLTKAISMVQTLRMQLEK